jgi:hypothetical protein
LFAQRKNQRKGPLPQSVANPNIVVFGVGDPSFGRIRVRRDASAQKTVLRVSKVMTITVLGAVGYLGTSYHDCLVRKCWKLEICY